MDSNLNLALKKSIQQFMLKCLTEENAIDEVERNQLSELMDESLSLTEKLDKVDDRILELSKKYQKRSKEAKSEACHCKDSKVTEPVEVNEENNIKSDLTVFNWAVGEFDRALLLTKDSYMRTEPPNLLNACKKTEELLNKEGFGIPEGSLYQRITRFKHNKGWYNEYQELHNPTEKQDATA